MCLCVWFCVYNIICDTYIQKWHKTNNMICLISQGTPFCLILAFNIFALCWYKHDEKYVLSLRDPRTYRRLLLYYIYRRFKGAQVLPGEMINNMKVLGWIFSLQVQCFFFFFLFNTLVKGSLSIMAVIYSHSLFRCVETVGDGADLMPGWNLARHRIARKK